MRKLKSVVFCIVFAMLYSGIQFAFGVIIGFVKLFSGADKTMIENTRICFSDRCLYYGIDFRIYICM